MLCWFEYVNIFLLPFHCLIFEAPIVFLFESRKVLVLEGFEVRCTEKPIWQTWLKQNHCNWVQICQRAKSLCLACLPKNLCWCKSSCSFHTALIFSWPKTFFPPLLLINVVSSYSVVVLQSSLESLLKPLLFKIEHSIVLLELTFTKGIVGVEDCKSYFADTISVIYKNCAPVFLIRKLQFQN